MALMAHKALQLVLILLVLGLMSNHHEVAAVAAAGTNKVGLSQEDLEDLEDLELERQLKMLNKPPIKTIQIEEGDIYNCIDIQKQPALDHPKLQNHQIQMRPSSYPNGFYNMAHQKAIDSEGISSLRSVDCPLGTVPIRKTTKEDLKRAKPFFESFLSNRKSIRSDVYGIYGTHEASHYLTAFDDEAIYFGVHGLLNVANPAVAAHQFSAAMVFVDGDAPKYEALNAGWAVSPQLFNDTRTRFYVYSSTPDHSTPDDSNLIGCVNLACKGFVQVSTTYALGAPFITVSEYNGTQYAFELYIFKDNATGNWWLRAVNHDLGYWPNDLFHGLEMPIVGWGGAVRKDTNSQCPQMGNGHVPASLDYKLACYVRTLKVVDRFYNFVDPPADPVKYKDYTDATLYKVVHDGEEPVTYFLFGGPSGYCQD